MAYTNTVTPAQKYKMFAPFFATTRAAGVSKGVDYDCIMCNEPVAPLTPGGRSFTGTAITWAHVDCVTLVGGTLSDDARARDKAKAAFFKRQETERKATRAANGPTVDRDTLVAEIEATLRAKIEAEYNDKMTQAVNAINALIDANTTLEAENDALKQANEERQAQNRVQNDTMSETEKRAARRQNRKERAA